MKAEIKRRHAIPSAYKNINSNRSIGYTMESAVADIIDNSISANASQIEVTTHTLGKPELRIIDDGCGMNQDELDNAMTFGGKPGISDERLSSDLGRYGLGLKTASLSQCRKLTVITKKEGTLIGGRWDLDVLKNPQYDSWDYIEIPNEECLTYIQGTRLETLQHGTLVTWENFDRLATSSSNFDNAYNKLVHATRRHLTLVYHRYLKGEEGIKRIRILFNNVPLEPVDPFLSSKTPLVAGAVTIPVGKEKIVITPHKLLHPSKMTPEEIDAISFGSSLMETQGFYVYRNKRLIIWGTWFRIAPKTDRTKLCRIQVDIPNAFDTLWSLDVKKSSAMPPESIREQLKRVLDNNTSLSIHTFRKKASIAKRVVPFWVHVHNPDNTYTYEINSDHPEIKHLTESLSDDQRKTFSHIMKDLAAYFPISQLQYDLQSDRTLTNSNGDQDKTPEEILNRIKFYLQMGLKMEDIRNISPICDYPEIAEQYHPKECHDA